MRYYLNVVTDNGLIKDPDGEEFPHIYAAMAEAEESARAVIVGELEAGRKLLPAWGVQIANSRGVVIDEVSFGAVLHGSGTPDRMAARAPAGIKEAHATGQESQRLGREVRESLAKTRAELRTLFSSVNGARQADDLRCSRRKLALQFRFSLCHMLMRRLWGASNLARR